MIFRTFEGSRRIGLGGCYFIIINVLGSIGT
jgi:hypothetical protein